MSEAPFLLGTAKEVHPDVTGLELDFEQRDRLESQFYEVLNNRELYARQLVLSLLRNHGSHQGEFRRNNNNGSGNTTTDLSKQIDAYPDIETIEVVDTDETSQSKDPNQWAENYINQYLLKLEIYLWGNRE